MKWEREESSLLRLLLFAFLPLMLGAFILAHLAPDFLLRIAHCPLRETTGLPCPACGGTLAMTRLAAGDWRGGLRANPLVFLAAGVMTLVGLWATLTTLIAPWRRQLVLSAKEKRTTRLLAILLVLINWIWLVLRYLR